MKRFLKNPKSLLHTYWLHYEYLRSGAQLRAVTAVGPKTATLVTTFGRELRPEVDRVPISVLVSKYSQFRYFGRPDSLKWLGVGCLIVFKQSRQTTPTIWEVDWYTHRAVHLKEYVPSHWDDDAPALRSVWWNSTSLYRTATRAEIDAHIQRVLARRQVRSGDTDDHGGQGSEPEPTPEPKSDEPVIDGPSVWEELGKDGEDVEV